MTWPCKFTCNKRFLPVSTSEWNGMSCSIGCLLRQCIDLQVRQWSKFTSAYASLAMLYMQPHAVVSVFHMRLCICDHWWNWVDKLSACDWWNHCVHTCHHYNMVPHHHSCYIGWLHSLFSHHVQRFWLPTGHLQPLHPAYSPSPLPPHSWLVASASKHIIQYPHCVYTKASFIILSCMAMNHWYKLMEYCVGLNSWWQ